MCVCVLCVRHHWISCTSDTTSTSYSKYGLRLIRLAQLVKELTAYVLRILSHTHARALHLASSWSCFCNRCSQRHNFCNGRCKSNISTDNVRTTAGNIMSYHCQGTRVSACRFSSTNHKSHCLRWQDKDGNHSSFVTTKHASRAYQSIAFFLNLCSFFLYLVIVVRTMTNCGYCCAFFSTFAICFLVSQRAPVQC